VLPAWTLPIGRLAAGGSGRIPPIHTSTRLTPMTARSATKLLLIFVLGLPLILAVMSWVDGLLTAMGDASAVNVLGHVSTVLRVIWLVCVVGLVVTLAIQSLDEPKNGPSEDDPAG